MSKTISNARPHINVTPLIDVLLVLLIVFMVVVPSRPHRLTAKLPREPRHDVPLKPDINTLVVTIEPDRTLRLNALTDMGTVDNMSKLTRKLVSLFEERTRNKVYRVEMIDRLDQPDQSRVEKTVFIKAPRSLPYGHVMQVIDGLKGAGAEPIGLQLDKLK
jgi:biopolymer transport protein ExbD